MEADLFFSVKVFLLFKFIAYSSLFSIQLFGLLSDGIELLINFSPLFFQVSYFFL